MKKYLALACTLAAVAACNDGERRPAQRPVAPVMTTTAAPLAPAPRGTSALWVPGPATGQDPMPTTAAGITTLGAATPQQPTTTMAQVAPVASDTNDTKKAISATTP